MFSQIEKSKTSKRFKSITITMKLFRAILLLCQLYVVAGQWVQVGNDIDGEMEGDWAGGTQKGLSMNGSGTTIAVGSSGHDVNGAANVGHVRVFDFDNKGLWLQRGLDIEGESAKDNSGSTVVLSEDGNVVAIGEPNSEAGSTDRLARDYGQVRVFEWSGIVWEQRGQPIAGDAKCDFASSYGGLAIDASGTTVVVGAAHYDVGGLNGRNQGQVRVFDWVDANWNQRGDDVLGKAPGDWFGTSVDINGSGDTVAVGAMFDDSDGARQGSVGIYDWNGGEWSQRGNDIVGEEDYDFSGSSLAINDAGDVVVVGSPQTNAPFGHSERGAATVYEWRGGQWQKRGSRIEGEANGDAFGSVVSISNPGNAIAVGASLNDGSSDLEGHVRVYDWNGNSWSKRGDDIDGENQLDYSGYSVTMSADGNTVASGARFTDDGAGFYAGHARIFAWERDDTPDSPNEAPDTDSPTEAPTVCEDDPDFRKGRRNKNCEAFLSRNAERKCNRNHPGGKVFDFCKQTCGEFGIGACDLNFVLD